MLTVWVWLPVLFVLKLWVWEPAESVVMVALPPDQAPYPPEELARPLPPPVELPLLLMVASCVCEPAQLVVPLWLCPPALPVDALWLWEPALPVLPLWL